MTLRTFFCSYRLPHLLVTALLLGGAAAGTLQAQTDGDRKPLGNSWRDQAEELLITKRDYKGAIALYNRWLEASPRDKNSWYNLACAYMLSGEKEGALNAFERSVDAGLSDAVLATQDPDLAPLRSEPRFKAALELMSKAVADRGPKDFIRHFSKATAIGTYVVMLPPDYNTSNREYPICLILHGNGSTELNHGKIADRLGREDVIFVAPRALYPNLDVMFSAGTAGWTARPSEQIPQEDPTATLVPVQYVDWIMNCVHEVQANYRARKGKVFVYGHSQGGHYATLTALLHPDEVASFLTQAGPIPADRFLTDENLTKMKREGVSAVVVHGREDNVVAEDNSTKLAGKLKEAGVPCSLKLVKGDHGFGTEIQGAVTEWITSQVRPAATAGKN